jgi:hypothetical protein
VSYQLQTPIISGQNINTVLRIANNLYIPLTPDNTDYQQFKKDIQNGVVLNDVDGNPITGDALKTFLATLP